MSFSLLGTLYILACSHAIFFAVILLKKAHSNSANKILASLLFVLAYKLFEGSLLYSDLYKITPHLLDWLPPAPLIIGPLCLAYVRSLSDEKPFSKIQWLIHMTPALVLAITNFPNLVASPEMKIAMWDNIVSQEPHRVLPFRFIMLLLAIKLHLAAYLLKAWQGLAKLEKHAEDNLSNNTDYLLRWQKKICIAFIVIEAIWVALFLLQNLGIISTLAIVGQFWLLLVSAVIFSLSYWGLQNLDVISRIARSSGPEIRKNPRELISLVIAEKPLTQRYQNSPLSLDSAEILAKLIKSTLRDQQLYLQPGLKLTQLAEAVGTKHHLVSQVINETLNTRFNSLVNKYRAEFAKSLLMQQKDHYNIEHISIESGFSNRVTFNKVFKSIYGVSPSIYKSELKEIAQRSKIQHH